MSLWTILITTYTWRPLGPSRMRSERSSFISLAPNERSYSTTTPAESLGAQPAEALRISTTFKLMDTALSNSLDQFDTPTRAAEVLLRASTIGSVRHCLDPACGRGNLLLAASAVFSPSKLSGVDRDGRIIRNLRRRQPTWTLTKADVTESSSITRLRQRHGNVDLLLVNPPFRAPVVEKRSGWRDPESGGSFAAYYLLTSLSSFAPSSAAIAIMPESFMYSVRDKQARDILGASWSCRVLQQICPYTFPGARARTLLVELRPRKAGSRGAILCTEKGENRPVLPFEVIRGGLPVFKARRSRAGVPFIHSCDIGNVVHSDGVAGADLKRVRGISRGIVDGHVLLLPRVGTPKEHDLRAVTLQVPTQLSDCVIALRFSSRRRASQWAALVRRDIDSLFDIYRGTGARYVTLDRLEDFLGEVELAHRAKGPTPAGDAEGAWSF